MRPTLRLLATLVAAVLLTAAVGVPAAIAAPAPVGPTRHLILELAATDPAALAALAEANNLGPDARQAALATITPSADFRAGLVTELRAFGVTGVDDGTAWTLPVSGPASLLDRVFPASGVAGVRTVPSWLSSVVRVVDADDTTPVMHHLGTLTQLPAAARAASTSTDGCSGSGVQAKGFSGYTGFDFATEYGANQPSCSLWTSSSPTTDPIIATIQYSGWQRGDIAVSAKSQTGSAVDPVATGQVTEVPVDGRSTVYSTSNSGCTDSQGNAIGDPTQGNDEVALDTEAILRSAPTLRQRIYFACNTSKGETDVYAAIIKDINTNHLPIRVISTSWGFCEQDRQSSNGSYSANAFPETLISTMVSTGATMLAASGDAGPYDCNDGSTLAVDYPGSSKYVLSIGGTTWPYSTAGSGCPNPARTECGWSSSDGSGSGGGFSDVFARPSYQSSAVSSAMRAVPDYSSDANAQTGMTTYSDGGWYLGGGTSLSSPLMAGFLASMELQRGDSSGLGDIHSALYQAQSTGFTDVTTGNSGNSTHYPATTGYDEATGLGTPKINTLGKILIPPVASAIAATSGANQSATTGKAFASTLTATVTASTGEVVPNATVTFSVPSASATFAGGATASGTNTVTAVTNANGVATSPVLTAGVTAGSISVTASVSGVSGTASFAETIVPGAASAVAATAGANQTTKPSAAFTTALSVTVTDSSGNPVPSITVTFTAPGSGSTGTFSSGATTTAVTNAAGVATAGTFTAGGTSGSFSVSASVSGVQTAASFPLTISTASALTNASGGGQTTRVSALFGAPLQVTVTDGKNPVSGITVTFTIPNGLGEFYGNGSTITETSDQNGLATSPSIIGLSAGATNATASINSATSVSYALTVLRSVKGLNPVPLKIAKSSVSGRTLGAAVLRGLTTGISPGRLTGAQTG